MCVCVCGHGVWLVALKIDHTGLTRPINNGVCWLRSCGWYETTNGTRRGERGLKTRGLAARRGCCNTSVQKTAVKLHQQLSLKARVHVLGRLERLFLLSSGSFGIWLGKQVTEMIQQDMFICENVNIDQVLRVWSGRSY